MTSSILAVFPSLTHEWKKLGATLTPKASLVIPVHADSLFEAMVRNVPNSRTSSLWVYAGRDAIILLKVTILKNCHRFWQELSKSSFNCVKKVKIGNNDNSWEINFNGLDWSLLVYGLWEIIFWWNEQINIISTTGCVEDDYEYYANISPMHKALVIKLFMVYVF